MIRYVITFTTTKRNYHNLSRFERQPFIAEFHMFHLNNNLIYFTAANDDLKEEKTYNKLAFH